MLEIIDASPTGKVYMSFDVLNVKASKNSFHAARKLNSAVTATAGKESGSTTLVKTGIHNRPTTPLRVPWEPYQRSLSTSKRTTAAPDTIGENKAEVGIEETECFHDQEVRNENDDAGEHLHEQKCKHGDVSARELVAAKGVAGRNSNDQPQSVVPMLTISELRIHVQNASLSSMLEKCSVV